MFEEKLNKIILPKGWEIDKIEGNEIILKESKKELPETWEECYKQLGKGEYIDIDSQISSNIILTNPCKESQGTLPVGFARPMLALMQLLVCREVYRQGWKPDWKDHKNKYCVHYTYGKIVTGSSMYINSILTFQSQEIRDKFLENFRDLIEEAKELL